MSMEDYEKEVERILKAERQKGYMCGKVDGAINVLDLLDVEQDKKLELLRSACGLCEATARTFLGMEENKED